MTALNDFSILLLLAHFLGDYQLQWDALAKEKAHKISGLLKHFAIHFALLAALLVWGLFQGLGLALLWPLLILFAVHVILDVLKFLLNRAFNNKVKHNARIATYILDQVLHLLAILLLSQVFFADASKPFELGSFLTREMLNWILLVTLITKPANISFKVLFERYQYKPENDGETKEDKDQSDTIARVVVGLDETHQPKADSTSPLKDLETLVSVPGAGAIIGNMERMLSAVFLAAGQWAAIGVVFTAKSIARFKQIEKNRQFAEYYLIGTLYSILFVVLAYFLVFKI